jgi:hypothetical protein
MNFLMPALTGKACEHGPTDAGAQFRVISALVGSVVALRADGRWEDDAMQGGGGAGGGGSARSQVRKRSKRGSSSGSGSGSDSSTCSSGSDSDDDYWWNEDGEDGDDGEQQKHD